MEASNVYYTDFRCPVGTSLLEKLRRLCLAAGIRQLDMEGKFVAIKMHFGELGNLAFLRPNYAKVVADLCKEQGGMPFLTDCNTLYPGSRKNATEVLEYFHCADWFGVFITGEDVVRSKPDPEGYLKAMAHFGVTPAETMIFEDSGPGLEAARASGATVYKVEAF